MDRVAELHAHYLGYIRGLVEWTDEMGADKAAAFDKISQACKEMHEKVKACRAEAEKPVSARSFIPALIIEPMRIRREAARAERLEIVSLSSSR